MAVREELRARRRAFSCSSSATRLRKDVMVSKEEDRGKEARTLPCIQTLRACAAWRGRLLRDS